MRVTQSYMMQVSAAAVSKSQSNVASASAEVTSGLRITKPSDGVAAWEEAERASIRQSESTQRGSAISLSIDRLQSTDGALNTINTALTSASSLATQMSNGTLDAAQRQAAAQSVLALRDTVLAAANTVGPDGKSVFGGSVSGAPFSASGVFSGDSDEQSLEISEGHSQTIGISGSVLTAANGVDVLGTLSNLATALQTNNGAGISTALDDLQTAQNQVTTAQATLGSQESALNNANDARSSFELQLTQLQTDSVGADTVTAASSLAQAQTAYNAATTVAALVSQLANKNIS